MTLKHRTEQELQRIKSAWKMTDDGVLTWISGWKTGMPVCIQTIKRGHQNCYLLVDGKIVGYSVGQIAWFLYYNEWPTQEVDHIDCDPKNHKRENLRLASRAEQCRNRVAGKKGRPNKGVYKRDYGNKWSAQIWVNKRCICLGTFDSADEAVEVRELATELLHGDFANKMSYASAFQE